MNLYAYVGNSPYNATDPTGEISCPQGQTCPDIPPATPEVVAAQIEALGRTSLRRGANEEAVTTFSDKNGALVTVRTGDQAGRNATRNRVTLILDDPPEGTSLSSTGHSHPRGSPGCTGCRSEDRANRLPSRDDLEVVLRETRVPLFVRGTDGTITQTYRINGIDYIQIVRPGSRSIERLTPDLSRDGTVRLIE
jgi:hypothetical protein